MRFAAAPEYQVFPTRERPLKPYEAAVKASAVTRELIRAADPEVVVADILTVAAALAAELEQRHWATLVPHVLPAGERGFPVYAVGAVYPRTRAGQRLWELSRPLLMRGEEQGRGELNGARARVGLPALGHVHGGISRELALVATFPQLEYPREVPPPAMRITGPLLWEQPFGDVDLPPGDDPLVLVAPSTSQDPEGQLLRAALDGPGLRAGAGAGHHQPARSGAAPAHAGQRAPRGLGLVREDHAALQRRGLPRRPRHARAGPRLRSARGGLPPRRRHGRERGTRALGGRGRLAAAPLPYCARSTAGVAPPARRAELRRAGPRAGALVGRARRSGGGRRRRGGAGRRHDSIPPRGTVRGMATETRGYSATKDQLQGRLRRIEGQVRGIEKMVDEERYCIDVLTQIGAVQAALDKVALGLLDDHARHCVVGGKESEQEEMTSELMAAVGRLMRRG